MIFWLQNFSMLTKYKLPNGSGGRNQKWPFQFEAKKTNTFIQWWAYGFHLYLGEQKFFNTNSH